MNQEAWAFAGIVVAAVIAVFGGMRSGIGQVRSATASEVTALGERLDAQAERVDRLERTNRALYAYIAADHAIHHSQGWPIIPLPPEIA